MVSGININRDNKFDIHHSVLKVCSKKLYVWILAFSHEFGHEY